MTTDVDQQPAYQEQAVDKLIISTLQSLDKGRFGNKDKILFFKELSYLLHGGISITESMHIIWSTSQNYAMREIASTIYSFMHEGKSLSYALNRLPDYFDQWDYSIVKAGEESGNLATILQSLAQEYVYSAEIKNKYIGALMYPIILIIISVVAVFALFALVLPNIFSIAESFQWIELPWITRALQSISLFFQYQWKTLLLGIAGILVVWGIFFSTETGKKSWFSLLLRIPLLGKMTQYFYLVRWCRYMKLLLSSWLNYLQTFQLLKDILWISAYQDMIQRVVTGLNTWKSIYAWLEHETDLIPSDVAVMIKVGEETANLPGSLDNVLQMYEGDLNLLIDRLAKVIEPIMLVFIWWIVVVIALWVFGLILQIMQGAGL